MNEAVRQTALYYKQNIVTEIPEDFTVHESFLNGCSKEAFKQGFFLFKDFLCLLFDHLINADDYNERDLKTLLKILVIFGYFGEFEKDKLVLTQSEDFSKAMKKNSITNINKHFQLLSDIGFYFGASEASSFKFKDFSIVEFYYPDSPLMCAAWSAISKACYEFDHARTFYHCDYRMFKDVSGKQPKAVLSDCIGSLCENDKLFLTEIDSYLLQNGYKLAVHEHKYKGTYTHKQSGYPILIFFIDIGEFKIRISGDCIKSYYDFFLSLPPDILEICKNGKECCECCHTCRKGIEIDIDRHYKKCRAENFMFEVTDENRDALKTFLYNEYLARK